MLKIMGANLCLAAIVLFCWGFGGVQADRDAACGADFEVVTDRLEYAPGSKLQAKFIVENTNEIPLYLSRYLSACSGQNGFVFFQILDKHEKDVRAEGCSGDQWPPPDRLDILQIVGDPNFWILLKQFEIYGGEDEFKLPEKKGIYRLKAELISPGFSEEQRGILSSTGKRVLKGSCLAPIVTVRVK